MDTKKHSWHGPKQIWVMIYTAILFLIGTSIIGGNNNTVFRKNLFQLLNLG